MTARIETSDQINLVGLKQRMSVTDFQVMQLWQRFMLHVNQISNRNNQNTYSVEVYDDVSYFEQFNPNKDFEVWAAVSVAPSDAQLPDQLESLTIPEGLYVVFIHQGMASEASKTYQFIYNQWIPESEYNIDNRPHFAVMPPEYRPDDPNATEEIWVPIKKGKR